MTLFSKKKKKTQTYTSHKLSFLVLTSNKVDSSVCLKCLVLKSCIAKLFETARVYFKCPLMPLHQYKYADCRALNIIVPKPNWAFIFFKNYYK